MHARVTISTAASVNIEALNQMLAENGMYLVTVHNQRIVELVKVPRGVRVVDGDEEAALPPAPVDVSAGNDERKRKRPPPTNPGETGITSAAANS